MKLRVLFTALVLHTALASAQKLTFVPQWTPQSQFAGYYVAKEKGFYSDEGLDVMIRHVTANSNETPMDILMSGGAQIVGQQLFQSIQHRSGGDRIVNVMQLTHKNGLCCVGRGPVASFKDLDGKRVCKWLIGYAEICEILEKMENVNIDWQPCFSLVNLYVSGAVDASLCYSYSELLQLDLATGGIPEENIIRFSDYPTLNIPEDGLYVTEQYYKANRETVEKFVRASMRGWDYAREHIDEALEISWKYVTENNIVTNHTLERRMLEEYLSLQVNPRTGKPDYAPVSQEGFKAIVAGMLDKGAIQNPVEYKDFVK